LSESDKLPLSVGAGIFLSKENPEVLGASVDVASDVAPNLKPLAFFSSLAGAVFVLPKVKPLVVEVELALSPDGVDAAPPKVKPDPLFPVAGAGEAAVLVLPNVKPAPLPEAVADDPPTNEKPPPALAARAGEALDAPRLNPEDPIAELEEEALVEEAAADDSWPLRGTSQDGHTVSFSSF
jgi:hypothetical protein